MSSSDVLIATVRVPASKLLSYRARNNPLNIEQIWNTREGYCPTEIVMSDGTPGFYAQLIDDRIVAEHRPQLGDRVFVDMTPQRARELASITAVQFWKDGTAYGRAAQLLFRSELEVVSYVFDNLLMDMADGVPYLETVTEEMAATRGWS